MSSITRSLETFPAGSAVLRARVSERVLPVLIALASFALYAVGLDRSGWANQYYSAAVLAGTKSWTAFFFGSLDAGSFITVDKPPAALWLMELSARIFGLSSWSILLPEALAGAATAVVLFFTVRRVFGPVAATIAAATSALTPVAVLMFRYNDPDALLTLLLVVAAWALTRALEDGRTRWLLLSAAAVGLGFNTKYLQAYLVLPALVLTYFAFGPHRLGKRFLQLCAAGATLVLASGWWLAIVDAIPADSRPYIGGSTNNTVLDLVFGYDGFGRILGQGLRRGLEVAGGAFAGGGGGPAGGFGGQPGLLRLFNEQVGGQVAWLIPLAVAGLVAGLWIRRRAPRRDLQRAAFVLWGSWFLVAAVVFSFAQGIFHSYYTVALAPAIGVLVGAGLPALWELRSRSWAGGLMLSGAIAVTAWLGYTLLARTPSFAPGVGDLELVAALLAASALLATRIKIPSVAPAAVVAGVAALMLGPVAYDLQTVASAYSGGDPTAGPALRDGFSGPGPAGAGADSQLVAYLEANQGGATWLVAVNSANTAAPLELASGKAVLAMGGFSGSDPAPTLAQLRALVASGKLRYVLLGAGGGRFAGGPPPGFLQAPGGGPPPPLGGGSTPAAIQSWVSSACKTVDAAGVSNLYDCAGAA